jgi:hypothetical protein
MAQYKADIELTNQHNLYTVIRGRTFACGICLALLRDGKVASERRAVARIMIGIFSEAIEFVLPEFS